MAFTFAMANILLLTFFGKIVLFSHYFDYFSHYFDDIRNLAHVCRLRSRKVMCVEQ